MVGFVTVGPGMGNERGAAMKGFVQDIEGLERFPADLNLFEHRGIP
jgi:hypothetical protein